MAAHTRPNTHIHVSRAIGSPSMKWKIFEFRGSRRVGMFCGGEKQGREIHDAVDEWRASECDVFVWYVNGRCGRLRTLDASVPPSPSTGYYCV